MTIKSGTKSAHARELHKQGVSVPEIQRITGLRYASVWSAIKRMDVPSKHTFQDNIHHAKRRETERALAQRLTLRCGECGREWVSTFRQCRNWFRAHKCKP